MAEFNYCPICRWPGKYNTGNPDAPATISCSGCGQYILIADIEAMLKQSRLKPLVEARLYNNPAYLQFVTYLRHKIWWKCVDRFRADGLGKNFKNYPALVAGDVLERALDEFHLINVAEQIDSAINVLALNKQGLFRDYIKDRTPSVFNKDMLFLRLMGLEIMFKKNPFRQEPELNLSEETTKNDHILIGELYRLAYTISDKHVLLLGNWPDLTTKGWQRFNEMESGIWAIGPAFMAMEFEYCEQAFKTIIKPAAEACGFELHTVDERPQEGSIPDDIELKIRRAPFVIADISHGNSGAYWEAGYATGLGKPVFYTCDKKTWEKKDSNNSRDKPEKPHFDIAHRQVVIWDKDVAADSETNQHAQKKLKALIRNRIPKAKLDD
jgi:nucleoside 2-deoxyribosyltransferase